MAADRRQRTRRLRSTSDWPHKFETPPQEREREQKYLDVISCGECETCEFKPYIDLSNKKAADLEKTACAFSNHRGGVIFIGVTDEGDVVGVTARDIAGRSDDPANALAEYEKAVRVRLRATLKDNQCFRSNVSAFAGKRAVVVEVELSREINYLVGSDLAQLAYVRRGKMSPAEIVAKGGGGVESVLRGGVLGQRASVLNASASL